MGRRSKERPRGGCWPESVYECIRNGSGKCRINLKALHQRYYSYRCETIVGGHITRQVGSYLKRRGYGGGANEHPNVVLTDGYHLKQVLEFANPQKRLWHAVVIQGRCKRRRDRAFLPIIFDTLPDPPTPCFKPRSQQMRDATRFIVRRKPYTAKDVEMVLLLGRTGASYRHKLSRDLPPKQRRRR